MRVDQLLLAPTVAEPLEIPAALLDSVNRHQAHLAALIASLRAAGFQEDMIDDSVRKLVDVYADELMIAIRGIMKGQHRE